MRPLVLNIIVVFLILSCSTNKSTDFEESLKKMRKERQIQLDLGDNMMLTERQFLFDTDSIMNEIYNELKNDHHINQDSLTIGQNEFLKRREIINNNLWNEINKIYEETGITPQLDRTIAYGTIADMNYERAIELNKILNRKK